MEAAPQLAWPDVAFEARLRQVLHSEVEFIALIGEDLVQAGGKRTRPAVTLLAAQALGVQPSDPAWDQILDLAVCIELLHSASLLHDDLIDDSQTRRGQETAFRRFGNVVSVMSGDFMLSRLLTLLAQLPHSPALTRAFGQTASEICEGEVLQFQVAAYASYSQAQYFKIIHGKTAALLELAASAPAILLRAAPALREALHTFGRHYGLAFQLRDDLLDLTSDEATLGKPAGHDLHEGKATYPVLLLLEGTVGPEVQTILERQAQGPDDLRRVQALLAQHDALQHAQQRIEQEVERATEALHALPDTEARQALTALAERERDRRS